ncbi:hypothetical protein MNBD_GAMMA06-1637 [hydrothermal vent metagenome]|uniref:Yip1 domain-containing protein n=1 Tax=hydrothermal vent metagenome TaxID=652676 RepID=A0A3B0WGI4_9ZZZZ
MSDSKNMRGNISGKSAKKLLQLLILKSTPQDLPYSLSLTVQLSVFYILSGIVVLQTTLSPDDIYAGILLGFIVQYAFAYMVLAALNKNARFMQTFCALIGAGLLFNLMSWPVFSVLANEATNDALKSSMSLVFLLLISWEVLVKAHIFKHALELKMFAALVLSFSLFFISVTLSQLLLPVSTGS